MEYINIENKEIDDLEEFNDNHAEVFFSNPFKIVNNYLYQYRITIVNDILELDIVKSYDTTKEEEEEGIYDDNSIVLVNNIIKLPLKTATKKMKQKIDLRIKDLNTKINNEKDELLRLYNELI